MRTYSTCISLHIYIHIICIHTYKHSYIHIYKHSYIYIHKCMHKNIHWYMWYIHISIHTFIYTYIHSYIHTCIHKSIHIFFVGIIFHNTSHHISCSELRLCPSLCHGWRVLHRWKWRRRGWRRRRCFEEQGRCIQVVRVSGPGGIIRCTMQSRWDEVSPSGLIYMDRWMDWWMDR